MSELTQEERILRLLRKHFDSKINETGDHVTTIDVVLDRYTKTGSRIYNVRIEVRI